MKLKAYEIPFRQLGENLLQLLEHYLYNKPVGKLHNNIIFKKELRTRDKALHKVYSLMYNLALHKKPLNNFSMKILNLLCVLLRMYFYCKNNYEILPANKNGVIARLNHQVEISKDFFGQLKDTICPYYSSVAYLYYEYVYDFKKLIDNRRSSLICKSESIEI